ncbi:MAG: hypothetical protein KKE36_01695, partial [Actinobacteria bacterium]|nr:hypothetical protein [Actinomycetota bacterium]
SSPVSRPSNPAADDAPAAPPSGRVARPSMDELGQQTAQPPAQPAQEAAAPEIPLAPIEHDFIALAEEQIAPFDEGKPPSTYSSEAAPAPGAAGAEVAAVADQSVPPGAYVAPERIALDDTLISGYQGEQAGGSVAGAGEQTADDPFGLNIIETAPPIVAGEYEEGRRFSLKSAWNIAIMILAIVIAGVVVYVGLYFGVWHKGLSRGEPASVVRDLSAASIVGDAAQINQYAAPGSQYSSILWSIIVPYEKLGTLSIKDFDAETTKMSNTAAQVEIKKFDLNLLGTSGKEVIPVLQITTPTRLPTTINLIRKDGKWLVTT